MKAQARVSHELRSLALELAPGARLPSVRELSRRHGASPVTVTAAMARLAGEGLVIPRPGHGTFVAERGSESRVVADFSWQPVAMGAAVVDSGGLELLLAEAGPDVVALSSGFPDESLLAVRDLALATARAARRPAAWARPPAEGVDELRAWFARDAGGTVAPRDVTIASGSQSALATVMRALGHPGDPILCESPTYIGALAAARGAGLVPVPVPVDRDGVRPEHLAEALRRTRARLIVLQPVYANPHGSVLSEARRGEVLELAEAHGAFIIEDEYVRDLWLDGRPPPAPLISRDRNGHVIHLRSLTKATAASLRIAGVIARGPAAERLRRARMLDDFFVSGVLQHAAVELLSGPAWPRHLRRMRVALRSRRDALIDAVEGLLPSWTIFQRPAGGLSLWIRLPDGSDETAVLAAATSAGVLVMPGAPWFPAEPSGPHLRLTYAAADEERLREGVARLARATRRR